MAGRNGTRDGGLGRGRRAAGARPDGVAGHRPRLVRRPGGAALAAAACVLFASAGWGQSAGRVIPLTRIGAGGEGYLADPQPIRRAPAAARDTVFLSGTTKAVVRCPFPPRPEGCGWTPLQVDAAGLRAEMAAAGVTRTNIQNVDLFQADDGSWHAAVTIGVQSPTHPRHWTVIAHAHPTAPGVDGGPPLAWSADTRLAGSFADPVEGNYDAKYYEEDGRLYLLYVRNAQPAPALRNEIVLQPLASFTQVAGPARTLLGTGDRFGALDSERFATTPAKLVEAPWLVTIGGKHALIYSTGSYLTPGYKAGVAWSDTLLPDGPDGRYRKVLQPDPDGIWRSAGGRDVRYLVQSERPRWPNFVGDAVIGPGVAAAVQGPGGAWWLFFNGYAPGDLRTGPDGRVDGAPRRPFALPLHAAVPPGASVAAASDAELAGWLTPGG